MDSSPPCSWTSTAPKTRSLNFGTFWIDVNGGSGVAGGATFAFSNKLDGNVHDNGFDEAVGALGGLITSVAMRSDTADNIYFKEVKQIDWSPSDPTGSPVPEPSTWVMMGAGFGFMALLGIRRRKTARYAI